MTSHSTSTGRSRTPGRARRGSVYLSIVSLGAIISALALGGLYTSANALRIAHIEQQGAEARSCAESAVRYMLANMRANSTWRSSTAGASVTRSVRIGSADVDITLTDPDGDLPSSALDPVVISAVARTSNAKRTVRVTALPAVHPLGCMSFALASSGSVSFAALSSINADVNLYSATGFTATLATINSNVYTSGSITGGSYRSTQLTGHPAQSFPASTVITDYASRATKIPLTSLPSLLGTRSLTRTLLSPTANPFGDPDPLGRYVIDCANSTINISDLRVVGTLILLNPGSGSSISGSVNFAPANPGQPVLLVDKDFTVNLSSSTLSENPLLATKYNYNPVGTPYPYPTGTTDADQADTYPSQINGLIFIRGDLTIQGTSRLGQVIVSGRTSISGTLTLTPSTAEGTTPQGFYTVQMTPAEGGWVNVYE
ncbi:MAG: hypothetical protein IBJ18_05275 [Phycisphaerales bacterium]|nr:hypothetical protein [Phycisphaerales bacterium]